MNQSIVGSALFTLSNLDTIYYGLLGMEALCLLLLYFFRWRDYLLPCIAFKKQSTEEEATECPKLSVVVTAFNEANELREHLFSILNQDYPSFEVIVVNEDECLETSDLLDNLKLRYQHLRTTFIPKSATEICRRKLSITLGVRAARSEWVVVTGASAIPQSDQWLKQLSSQMKDHTDIVLGYANYVDDGSSEAFRAIYERLMIHLRCLRSTFGYGAIGGDELNFCIRKEAFLQHRGYAEHLGVCVGESHLLIDSLSTAENVGVAFCPEATVRESLQQQEVLSNSRIAYREVLSHSSKRARLYLWREGFASMVNYLFPLLFVAYVLVRIGYYMRVTEIPYLPMLADFGMLLLTLAYVLLPVWLLRRTTNFLKERKIGMIFFWWMLKQPFDNFCLKIKRRKVYGRF